MGRALEDFPAPEGDKVLDVNLTSPFFLTRSFLPLLKADATADDPARVINIGSIDRLRVPNYSCSAGKAALHHLTRVLAAELGHVTVNAVGPRTVRVEHDGGDPGGARRCDRRLLTAGPHRAPG